MPSSYLRLRTASMCLHARKFVGNAWTEYLARMQKLEGAKSLNETLTALSKAEPIGACTHTAVPIGACTLAVCALVISPSRPSCSLTTPQTVSKYALTRAHTVSTCGKTHYLTCSSDCNKLLPLDNDLNHPRRVRIVYTAHTTIYVHVCAGKADRVSQSGPFRPLWPGLQTPAC
jgi:hypothetical protein